MRFSLYLAAGLAALSAPTMAEDTTTDAVIVSASRLQDDTRDLPASVTIITEADIAASTARDLPELLEQQAGITSRSLYGNNAIKESVDMRGFGATGTQNTLILVDGRRLNDVDLAAVDYSAIPLANIDRIEIQRGSGAVLYGDSAVGGVINIITKQSGKSGVYGTVELGGGSYGTQKLNARFNHGLGALSYGLFVNGVESDGYRDNNEVSQRNVQADVRYSQAKQEVFLKLGGNSQELRFPGARTVDPGLSLNELVDDRTGTSTLDDYGDENSRFVTAGYSRFLSDDVELILDAGQRSKYQETFSDFGGGFTDYWETDLSTVSVTPRIKINHGLFGGKGTGIIGVDYYDSDYRSDRGIAPDSIATPAHQLEIDQQSQAIYANNTSTISKVTVNTGLRYQQVSQTGKDTLDLGAPGGAFESEAADYDETYSANMYDLGVRYHFSDTASSYINLARAVRFATVDELYEYDAFFSRVFSPLEPQTSNGITIGTDIYESYGSYQASLYYMELENEIHFNPATFTNDNLDPTQRYGAEFATRYPLAKSVDAGLTYTFTQSKFREGAYEGNDVPLVAAHSASLNLLWKITKGLKLSATGNYVGSKRFDNDQNNTADKIPAYTTLDMKLAYQRGRFQVEAAVYNATDEEAFDYGAISTFTPGRYNAYPLPGRNGLLTVGMDF